MPASVHRPFAWLQTMIDSAERSGNTASDILKKARDCSVDACLLAACQDGKIHFNADSTADSTADIQTLSRNSDIAQTVTCALYQRTLKTLKHAFDENHIDFIVLKGPALSLHLFGDIKYRSTGDIDIWVHKNQRKNAENAIQTLGFERQAMPREWATNQSLWRHTAFLPVEIHWMLTQPPLLSPDFECAFRRSIPSEYLHGCHVLGDKDLWIHLLLHAWQHLFALKPMLDLLAASEKFDARAQEFNDFAQSFGMRNVSTMIFDTMRAFDKISDAAREKRVFSTALSAQCLRLWLSPMLSQTSRFRGPLALGKDSKVEAGLGVLFRALSMQLLDGKCLPRCAAAHVLFLGPHKIGAFCHLTLSFLRAWLPFPMGHSKRNG